MHLSPGSLFANRYVIEQVAGTGGMGTVYRARDSATGETVALKLINSRDGSALESERLSREARLLAELPCSGIVNYVTEGRTVEGEQFLIMEWLDGEDLSQRLGRGLLSLRDALLMTQRIAEAMAIVHQRGIIHRDLKPTNLFLPQGDVARVKILDFGIARRIKSVTALTRTGLLLGTPAYMAPEMVAGRREITAAADVFSLGCILYECLTGKPPFGADHLYAVLVCILFDQPPEVSSRRPDIPQSVSELLQRMLMKDPAQRLADAGEVVAALSQLGALPEVPAQSAGAPARPRSDVFSDQEQVLLSLVIASPPQQAESAEATRPETDEVADSGRRQALITTLRNLNLRADLLLDGSFVASVPQFGSARDQAMLAARVALLIKEGWPSADVVVATGRGTAQGATTLGEVAERAAGLIRRLRNPSERAPDPRNGVYLDELSAALLSGQFILEQTPAGMLLLGESKEADASRPLLGKPTPCVGRDAELAMLEAQLSACIDESEPRVIQLIAPPGIGKSRLRHEFLRRLDPQRRGFTTLPGRGDMMSAGAPYGIIGRMLRHHSGVIGAEPLAEQRRRMRERLAVHLAPSEQATIAFIGELCGVPFEEPAIELQAARQDPKIMRDHLRRAFLKWLAAELRAVPVLIILDDLQWGDELSVSLINDALHEGRGSPLFVLALARPEVKETFPGLWDAHGPQRLVLKSLSRKACERLSQHFLEPGTSAEELSRIVDQSAGNALFLEELIRAAVEGNASGQCETVVAMLQARIGRFEPGPRRLVRAASIFGQSFWRGGVATLLGLPAQSPDIEAWLAALVKQEVIEPHAVSRFADEKEYRFRHALLREAAYGLLTDQDRALGHRLAGACLEQQGEQDAMVLAEHAQRGGDLERAAIFYARAAEQCFERHDLHGVLLRSDRGLACGATRETLGHLRAMQSIAFMWGEDWTRAFDAGMAAIEHLPHGSSRWLRIISYMFVIAGNLPDQEPMQQLFGLFSRVDPLASEPLPYLQSASFLTIMFSMLGLRPLARPLLEGMQRRGANLGADDAVARGILCLGQSWFHYYLEPDAYEALRYARQASVAFTQAGDDRHLCVTQLVLGLAELRLGDTAAALQTLRKNLALALRLEEPFNVSMAEFYLAQALSQTPDGLSEGVGITEKMLRTEQNARSVYIGGAHCVRAQFLIVRGELGEAESAAREAIAILTPLPIQRVAAMIVLARILLLQQRSQDARHIAEEALQVIESCGGIGPGEIAALVTAAEARHAAGEGAGAHTALREAVQRLAFILQRIPDPAMRQCFVSLPENHRALELEQAWNLQPSSIEGSEHEQDRASSVQESGQPAP